MNLSDLLASYNNVGYSSPEVARLLTPPSDSETFESMGMASESSQKTDKEFYEFKGWPYPKKSLQTKGSEEFERAYDAIELIDPDAKRLRPFLTKIAKVESNFRRGVKNPNAPAYGWFLFWQDGKTNNITTYAKSDINTFLNNPMLQILSAIKLAKDFERQLTKKDKELAAEKGFTHFGLLGGAWLGGIGGVRKVLKGTGNPSDKKHYAKNGKSGGTSVLDRIREFNFKYGGKLWKE